MQSGLFTQVESQTFRIWQAPLVPVAFALTAGILLDHFLDLSLIGSLFAASLCLVGWVAGNFGRSRGLPLMYLFLAIAALGAAWYHYRLKSKSINDVSYLLQDTAQPFQARGIILESLRPSRQIGSLFYPVYANEDFRPSYSVTTLQLQQVRTQEGWNYISGNALLVLRGAKMPRIQAGDEVEILGHLLPLRKPANPAESDNTLSMLARGIRAVVFVKTPQEAVTRLQTRPSWSPSAWLNSIRNYGERTLRDALPDKVSRLASAILLGNRRALTDEEQDRYRKTGVVHVLVISGQHFLVLAVFLQTLLRILQVRQRRGVALVAGFLIVYALLVGMRPPVTRALFTFLAISGGLLLRRHAFPANAFALAWIVVVLLNPAEVFNFGCQLSFLAVATLHWIAGPLFRWGQEIDPLERQLYLAKPPWQQLLLQFGREILLLYGVTLVVWLVLLPLIVARVHIVPLMGLLLGPPVMLCVSLAVVCGFLLLVTAPIFWPLASVFAWFTTMTLSVCDYLIDLALRPSFSYQWFGSVPSWWLIVFYLLFIGVIVTRKWERWPSRRMVCLLVTAWFCVGLFATLHRSTGDEFRVTFLSVGQGVCTVMETPEGRVLLSDAGSLHDPAVVQRRIAPYLWHRGIRRIDELLLSHAHLDHYSGIPELVERFTIGQVTCTSTFLKSTSPEVIATLELLRERDIPIRTVHQGQRLQSGSVQMDVLHPPSFRIADDENAQSLVLLVQHEQHRILLTGDLSGIGLDRLLAQPKIPVDVLMAPHHGSKSSNTPELARWAEPRIIVSSQGRVRSAKRGKPYRDMGALWLTTWEEGAITVRSHSTGLILETFKTGRKEVIRSGWRNQRKE